MPAAAVRTALEGLGLDVHTFDTAMAYSAGALRPVTRGLGLSLGDRACLALGLALSAPVLTTDRSWKKLRIGAKIRVIR